MSYRKNRYPQNPKKSDQQERIAKDITYANSGEDKTIYTGNLTSIQSYQRPIEKKVVEHLVKEWDELLFDPIAVSFRDGKFHVVDGLHRVHTHDEALARHLARQRVFIDRPRFVGSGTVHQDLRNGNE